ncbi:MAG: two-component system response regulator NreC [Myxococcota bacterium]|jgi:two-component system response regulator NreC
MSRIRVLIADDHGIMRDGLRTLIDSQPDLQVVGEVDRADVVCDAAVELAADLVVLDLTMPGGGGLSALPNLQRLRPRPRVLVLTMHDRTAYLRQALEAGADGYVVKAAAGSVLLDAIRTVAGGERFIHASLPEGGVDEVLAAADADGVTDTVALSPREQEVLEFVAAGYTNREAADKLGLSVKTVEGYRARLARKLGARSRVDLVRFAIMRGLLDAPEEG